MATATKTRTKAAPKPAPEPEPETKQSAAAAKKAELEAKKAEKAESNGKMTEQVLEMREDGKKWQEIADELGITPGKAMFLDMKAAVASSPKLKITWKDDAELAEAITNARTEDMLSWGQISARTGLSEGKLKKVFASAAGDMAKGHRIGKGGRFPKGVEPPPKPAKATKAAGTSKATGTANKPLVKVTDLEEMGTRLNGKTIKVTRNGKDVKLGVKTVKDLANGTVTFISDRGQNRSIKVEEITVTRTA